MSTTDETRDAQSGVAEVLVETLMTAVVVPGPIRIRRDEALVLTSAEARRAADHLAAALGPLLAAERAKAWEDGHDCCTYPICRDNPHEAAPKPRRGRRTGLAALRADREQP